MDYLIRKLNSKKQNKQTDKSTVPITGLAKKRVQCSADTPDSYRDVVNQSLVLRINPEGFRDGGKRHLRQAAIR